MQFIFSTRETGTKFLLLIPKPSLGLKWKGLFDTFTGGRTRDAGNPPQDHQQPRRHRQHPGDFPASFQQGHLGKHFIATWPGATQESTGVCCPLCVPAQHPWLLEPMSGQRGAARQEVARAGGDGRV